MPQDFLNVRSIEPAQGQKVILKDSRAVGIGITDNPNASGALNFTYDSGIGSGVIDKPVNFEDGFSVAGVLTAQITESTPTDMLDNQVKNINSGQTNQIEEFVMRVRLKTPSLRSWFLVQVFYDGSTWHASRGATYGNEFFDIQVSYNLSESLNVGKHVITLTGSGQGAFIEINTRSQSTMIL